MDEEYVNDQICKIVDLEVDRFRLYELTKDELFEIVKRGVAEIGKLTNEKFMLVSSIKISNNKLVVNLVQKYIEFDDLIDQPNIEIDFDGDIKRVVKVEAATKGGIVEFVYIEYAKLPTDYKQLLIDLGLYKVDVIESVSVLCKRG